jgi:hypothetical protein
MLKKLRQGYHPHQVVLLRPDAIDDWLLKTIPALDGQVQLNGKATAYVCQDYQCSAPTTDPEKMIELLGG